MSFASLDLSYFCNRVGIELFWKKNFARIIRFDFSTACFKVSQPTDN
jgi:hypothetical protein